MATGESVGGIVGYGRARARGRPDLSAPQRRKGRVIQDRCRNKPGAAAREEQERPERRSNPGKRAAPELRTSYSYSFFC